MTSHRRTRTINTKNGKQLQVFNRQNHPQRGVVGLFVGFPRFQSGFYIFVPKSRRLYTSADVTFDESFATPVGTNDRDYREALGHHVGHSLDELHPSQVLTLPNPDDASRTSDDPLEEEIPSDGWHQPSFPSSPLPPSFPDDDCSSIEEENTSDGDDEISVPKRTLNYRPKFLFLFEDAESPI